MRKPDVGISSNSPNISSDLYSITKLIYTFAQTNFLPSQMIRTFIAFGLCYTVLAVATLAAAEEPPPPPPPLRIGTILPLSGAVAEYGVAAKNGIELAKRDHPELFNNVQFVHEDSAYDNKNAIAAADKLRATADISLLYVWGQGPCQATAPIAEESKFPLIAVSAERGISAQHKYVLRFAYYHQLLAEKLLGYLRAHDVKQIAVVKTDIAYMDGLISGMKQLLRDGEELEVVASFKPEDSDFRSTISKLQKMRFDSLGVFLIQGQIGLFYRQGAQQNFKPETFGTDFFDSTTEVRDAQGAMDGTVFAAPNVKADFIERYRKAYGNDAQVPWAANGYEFALLAARLFPDGRGNLSSDDIVDRFRHAEHTGGEAAPYKFHDAPEGPGFDFEVQLKKVDGDRIVEVGK